MRLFNESSRSYYIPMCYSAMVKQEIRDLGIRWDARVDIALITDEPPAEVLETGQDRCPIFLNEARIDDWLNPEGKSVGELFEILDDRQRPFYEHALAG